MGRPRSELSAILHGLCENVYFQPPTGTVLTYPCIVYKLDKIDVRFADNNPYIMYDEYSITYITRDPDDENRHRIAFLSMCSMTNSSTNDNLYHYNYRIYF